MNWLKLLRLYSSAGLAALLSLVSAPLISSLADNEMARGIYQVAVWFPAAALLISAMLAAWTAYRCRQAAHGIGPICPYCEGPLGPEKLGRYSPHRTCLACGKHVNERHYR